MASRAGTAGTIIAGDLYFKASGDIVVQVGRSQLVFARHASFVKQMPVRFLRRHRCPPLPALLIARRSRRQYPDGPLLGYGEVAFEGWHDAFHIAREVDRSAEVFLNGRPGDHT